MKPTWLSLTADDGSHLTFNLDLARTIAIRHAQGNLKKMTVTFAADHLINLEGPAAISLYNVLVALHPSVFTIPDK